MTRVHGKWIGDSRPGPLYTNFRHDGLLLNRVVFQAGQWQTMFYENAFDYPEMATVHIQPRGTLVDPDGVMPDRVPGWINREDTTPCPGGYRKRIARDEVELWCVNNRDALGNCDHVAPLTCRRGIRYTLHDGESWFHIFGSIEVDGEIVSAPAYIKARGKDRKLKIVADGYAFRWTQPQMRMELAIPQTNDVVLSEDLTLPRDVCRPEDREPASEKDENEI